MCLFLEESHLQQMFIHVTSVLPHEGCGLIAGSSWHVRRVYPITNIEKSPIRYRMDPREQIRTMIAIEQARWELLGIFHSHPCGPETPSVTDQEQAYYPETVSVILSRSSTMTWQARGFQLAEQKWVEVELNSYDLNGHP